MVDWKSHRRSHAEKVEKATWIQSQGEADGRNVASSLFNDSQNNSLMGQLRW